MKNQLAAIMVQSTEGKKQPLSLAMGRTGAPPTEEEQPKLGQALEEKHEHTRTQTNW